MPFNTKLLVVPQSLTHLLPKRYLYSLVSSHFSTHLLSWSIIFLPGKLHPDLHILSSSKFGELLSQEIEQIFFIGLSVSSVSVYVKLNGAKATPEQTL